jgi:glucuronate isomerase
MKTFMDDNFLLSSDFAERLYHEYAANQPIIDYHNHLSPFEIATVKRFNNLAEAWLAGDHYKWRAMRANGIPEAYITGGANDKDKFLKWAETVPYTMRNPIYHWTHLELKGYFGITDLLNPKTADTIYEQTKSILQRPEYSSQSLLKKYKVEVVCTTDDPTDSLEFHQKHANSNSELKMLPTFRPDKLVMIGNPDFLPMLEKLEGITGSEIDTFDKLMAALEDRIEFFHENDCRLSDHGMAQMYATDYSTTDLDNIIEKRKAKNPLSKENSEAFQSAILHHLAEMYHAKNWTMQFHLGVIRNNNSRLLKEVGADAGCDSIGDFDQVIPLATFLDNLESKGKLTKTILYNLNPRDNEVFATMAGNFQDGNIPGKIQWGSAWWFLDQKDGMEKQINTLSNLGLLSRFLGMLTDSRSFLSFPRHEYFRRVLCNLIGNDVTNGELPNDMEWLGKMVEDICYGNAKRYFDFR